MTTTSSDISDQDNELCALAAIYGAENVVSESCSFATAHDSLRIVRLHLSHGGVDVTLRMTLCSSYPSQSPPIVEISCPALNHGQKSHLYSELQEIYLAHIGEPVLFAWMEAVRKKLQDDLVFSQQLSSDGAENADTENAMSSLADLGSGSVIVPGLPDFVSGNSVTDRKSTFQAHLATPLTHRSQVPLLLELLKSRGKVARATHNIYAFRLNGTSGDCDDDGETQAGARLLHLMHMMRVDNSLVVVSRWYGGVHLGTDRFKHINNVARTLLEAHGFGKHRTANAATNANR